MDIMDKFASLCFWFPEKMEEWEWAKPIRFFLMLIWMVIWVAPLVLIFGLPVVFISLYQDF